LLADGGWFFWVGRANVPGHTEKPSLRVLNRPLQFRVQVLRQK
jgi:hypothetical protein